jgi:hypothetical protein
LDSIQSVVPASFQESLQVSQIVRGRRRQLMGRNPLLMTFHYVMAVVVALVCGFLFYGITNDIPGFQYVVLHLERALD